MVAQDRGYFPKDEDLQHAVEQLQSASCTIPFLSEVCSRTTKLSALFGELSPVAKLASDSVENLRPADGAMWEQSWSYHVPLFSIPNDVGTTETSEFCERTSIDLGYCRDFRCFADAGSRPPGISCPAPLQKINTRALMSDWMMQKKGFDQLCEEDLCFPIERRMAEARRFLAVDSKLMAADLQKGVTQQALVANVLSRYRCWLISEEIVALGAGGLGADDVKNLNRSDCQTARTLITKLQVQIADQISRIPRISTIQNLALPSTQEIMAQESSQRGYMMISESADPSSPFRGIALSVTDDRKQGNGKVMARLLMVVGGVKDQKGLEATQQKALDLGIEVAAVRTPNGELSVPTGFGIPVIRLNIARLNQVLGGLLPPGPELTFAVDSDSVRLASKFVPLTFDASIVLPGFNLRVPLGTLKLDCSLKSCGLSVLNDKTLLYNQIDQQIRKMDHFPSAGSVNVVAPRLCSDEERLCLTGNLASPNLAAVFGNQPNIVVKLFPPPNGRMLLYPNPTPGDDLLRSLSERLSNELKSSAPAFNSAWIEIINPRFTLDKPLGISTTDFRLSWRFSADIVLRLGDRPKRFSVAATDAQKLDLHGAVSALGESLRDDVSAFAQSTLKDATVTEFTSDLLAKVQSLKLFGKALSVEGLACKNQFCTFSLTPWFSDVYASANGVLLCFSNAKVGSALRDLIQKDLPMTSGKLEVSVERISISQAANCSAGLPPLSVDIVASLPFLGMQTEAVSVTLDPNSGAVSVPIRSVLGQLQAFLKVSNSLQWNGLPFTVEKLEVGDQNAVSLSGKFGIPLSSPIVNGNFSLPLYPTFGPPRFDCTDAGNLGAFLKIPGLTVKPIKGCGVFPIHIEANVALPVVLQGTPISIPIDLSADGRLSISDLVRLPLPIKWIQLGTTPFGVSEPSLLVYLQGDRAGDFALSGSVEAAEVPIVRIEALFEANLSAHTLRFSGPFKVFDVPLASLRGTFDGQTFTGEGDIDLKFAKATDDFHLILSPFSYVQNLNVNLWNQTVADVTLMIAGSGGCGESGQVAVCVTGGVQVDSIGKAHLTLYLSGDFSDFAGIKGDVKLANVAAIDFQATPTLMSVGVDAGIVKLSIVLPGLRDLTADRILREIAGALANIHIDPSCLLHGSCQITLGGHGGGGGNGAGDDSDGGDGLFPGGSASLGSNSTLGGQGPQGTPGKAADHKVGGARPAQTGPPGAASQGQNQVGQSEQALWQSGGQCEVKFSLGIGNAFQRSLNCPGNVTLVDSCPWSSFQHDLTQGATTLPESIGAFDGARSGEFSGALCDSDHLQYRIYIRTVKKAGDCASGICVLQLGGASGMDVARSLGDDNGKLLRGVFRLTDHDDPSAYMFNRRENDFTSEEWEAMYVLSKSSWKDGADLIQSLECYLPVDQSCRLYVVTRNPASPKYSLITAAGEIPVTDNLGKLRITSVIAVPHEARADGMLAMFDSSEGRKIGWFRWASAPPLMLDLAEYRRRRSCWADNNYAPPLNGQEDVQLLDDFDPRDEWSTRAWKERGWRKDPLLLFEDVTCKDPTRP